MNCIPISEIVKCVEECIIKSRKYVSNMRDNGNSIAGTFAGADSVQFSQTARERCSGLS
jgi:hypothetical protein